jgi:hypothetical protein
MRKYNNTGHFRLLNQLRGELKSQPIVRNQPSQERLSRTVEVRPAAAAYQASRTRRTQHSSAESHTASSFRERLNAIEMR